MLLLHINLAFYNNFFTQSLSYYHCILLALYSCFLTFFTQYLLYYLFIISNVLYSCLSYYVLTTYSTTIYASRYIFSNVLCFTLILINFSHVRRIKKFSKYVLIFDAQCPKRNLNKKSEPKQTTITG